jgi:ketosteroid isomerase-like protein
MRIGHRPWIILLLGVAGVELRAQPAADSASVTAFYGRWFGSASQGFTAYASFYAPDGYILPPNAAPVVGRPAIAAWFEQARAAATYVTQPQGIEVNEMRFLAPTWVVHRSTLKGQRAPRSGGPPVPFETKYVDLLHRLPGGEWEVVFRMWSDNR